VKNTRGSRLARAREEHEAARLAWEEERATLLHRLKGVDALATEQRESLRRVQAMLAISPQGGTWAAIDVAFDLSLPVAVDSAWARHEVALRWLRRAAPRGILARARWLLRLVIHLWRRT
jgi:hypothetical protein